MAILVSFFSHKGGVGKTTDIHNMACVLTKEFKLKVLLIDADPQCNLTSVVMNNKFKMLGKKANTKESNVESEEEEEDLQHLSRKERTLARRLAEAEKAKERALEEAEQGEELFNTPDDPVSRNTIYKCFESKEFANFANQEELVRRAKNEIVVQEMEEFPGLFFLPGDIQMITLETDLSRGFTFGAQHGFGAFAKYPGSVSQLFREVAKKNEIDLILVDLNPGASALNQTIVMGSDYFIISNLPDYYSRRAIDSIARVIKNWKDNIAPFQDSSRTTEFFQMPRGPQLLGYLVNRVKIRKIKDKLTDDVVSGPIKTQGKKIEFLKQEVDKKLLKIPGLTSSNYRIMDPPLIKEFDRTAGEATESGMSMSYVVYDKVDGVKSTTLTKREVANSQTFFLNAFFSAIKLIFSNLSDEHHLLLGNKFRPSDREKFSLEHDIQLEHKKRSGKITDKKRKKAGTDNLLYGLYNGETIEFSYQRTARDNNCALHATGFSRHDIVKSLLTWIQKDPNFTSSFIEEEVQDAFVSGGLQDEEYNKLKGENVQRAAEYEASVQELRKKYPVLEGTQENEKLAYAQSLGDVPLAVNFLTAFREKTTASMELRGFYNRTTTVIAFIDQGIAIDKFWLGVKTLHLYAMHKKIDLRIWDRDPNNNNLTLRRMRHPIEGASQTINICYEEGSHFAGLTEVPPSQKQNPLLLSKQAKSSSSSSSSERTVRQKTSPSLSEAVASSQRQNPLLLSKQAKLSSSSSASSSSSSSAATVRQQTSTTLVGSLPSAELAHNLPSDQIIRNARDSGIPRRVTRSSTSSI